MTATADYYNDIAESNEGNNTRNGTVYVDSVKPDLAIVDKRRVNDQKAEVMHILGEVKGKNVLIIDDIITTAGSIREAAAALKKSSKLKGSLPGVRFHLGLALIKSGKKAEGLEILERLLDELPESNLRNQVQKVLNSIN